MSLINAQSSQNLLLKVDPLSIIRNNELIAKAKGEQFETSAVRVFVSNKTAIYEIRVFVSRISLALEQPNIFICFVVVVE